MAAHLATPAQLEYLMLVQKDFPSIPDTPYDSPFLRLLVSADRGQLSQSFIERQCVPGEIVFEEGEPGDTLFLIRSGRVAIFKGSLDSPAVLAYRRAGEIIGEMALLENQPRSATIVALENLRLLGINRQRFEQLLTETPSASRSIMEMLSSSLRRMSQARSTGELSEKRLSQQVSDLQNEKDRLESLQHLRQETTELIIHDLRNPLSTISISLRMLSLVLPEEILQANHEILEIAQVSVDRLQRLVDSLLEVSRMESGETPFSMAPFDLEPMIVDLAHRSAILARQGVQIEVDVPADLPQTIADREKIERVLANLMDNALKYTPEMGQIGLSARQKVNWLEISVSDSGPGIPPEDRQRIFERFSQGAGEKARRRGFGLGLTYCRLAIERHGGRIWIEPGVGELGSRFVFTLPVVTLPLAQHDNS
jgi:signal transduction histidine kinase